MSSNIKLLKDKFDAARQLVLKQNISVAKAAIKFDINRLTLRAHVKKIDPDYYRYT